MNATAEDKDFEALLEYLKATRGFDFTSYKTASLARRIQKQMATHKVASYGDYIDFLEVHPNEFAALFNTVLINVTSFFRDPDAWRALEQEVVPKLAQLDSIRVWTAGCATGQETYTIAMVLAEQLGDIRFRERVKIYATDADDHALTQARQALYSAKELEAVPELLRTKYFEQNTQGFFFKPDFRRSIIFGRHDLLQDAPMSRLNLLICRNTLIYFNAEAQARIMARFHFALRDEGFLFLGKSELLLSHARLFTPVNVRARIFTKMPKAILRERLLVLAQAGNEEANGVLVQQTELRDESFDANPVAQLVLDREGTVLLINQQARRLFELGANHLARPFQDLEVSYRPIELRSRLEQAYATRSAVMAGNVEHNVNGDIRFLDVIIVPLFRGGVRGEPLGATVSFNDVSATYRLSAELEQSAHELESAYGELQASNEELETTNEELQSTVEELETTNEELQSTNEELETMNEELQSTNEELETINEALRKRTEQLNDANAHMDSIMTSLLSGVIVVDRNLHVRLWNARSQELWGMRYDEVIGKSLASLDIGLPVDQLRKPLRAAIEDDVTQDELKVAAVNRRGRAIECQIRLTRLRGHDSDPLGAIIFVDELPRGDGDGRR
jgi:two-component system CheB/CheR fusion protein